MREVIVKYFDGDPFAPLKVAMEEISSTGRIGKGGVNGKTTERSTGSDAASIP